jgi:hypothetical protein
MMHASRFAGMSIWAAALRAAGCRANALGQSFAIQWQPAGRRLQYTATENVTVEPFGVALHPGETLEVGWLPGDTGYRTGIRPATSSR